MKKKSLIIFLLVICSVVYADQATHIIPQVRLTLKKTNELSATQGAKTILTHEYLQSIGHHSLSQVLQHQAGIEVHDTVGNNSSTVLSMRGFGANASSNTLLLVNGIPMTNPDLMPLDLNVIPIEQIRLIEIIAGSESVLYGDQAVGGIINIVTGEPLKENMALSVGAGSYNFYRSDAAFQHQFKQHNLYMTVANQHTDNYRAHNQFDQQNLFGNWRFIYPRGTIHLNMQISQQDMQYPGQLSGEQVAQNRRQAKNDTDFFKNWGSFVHASHLQELSPDLQLQTDLSQRLMKGHGVLSSAFQQSRTIYYLKSVLLKNMLHAKIATGVDGENDQYQLNSLFGLQKNRQTKYSIFSLANIIINPFLSLSVGLRAAQQYQRLTAFSSFENLNRAFATTLGLAVRLKENLQFYLRRAESYRFPKADENSSSLQGLRTQRGVSYETGLQFKQDHYSARLEIYQLNLRDEIAFDPTQTIEQPFGGNRNLSPTMRRGISLSGKAGLTDDLDLDAQYHLLSAKFQNGVNAGNRIPLVAENIFRMGLQYHLANNWSFYTEAVYTGNQFSDSDDANVNGKLGGYTLYNFNLNYRMKKLLLSFAINNIFNKEYYFYTVYQASANGKFYYPAPDRNFMLTLRWMI